MKRLKRNRKFYLTFTVEKVRRYFKRTWCVRSYCSKNPEFTWKSEEQWREYNEEGFRGVPDFTWIKHNLKSRNILKIICLSRVTYNFIDYLWPFYHYTQLSIKNWRLSDSNYKNKKQKYILRDNFYLFVVLLFLHRRIVYLF